MPEEVWLVTDNKTARYLGLYTAEKYAKSSVRLSYHKIGEPVWKQDNISQVASLPNGDEIRVTPLVAMAFQEHL